MKTNLLLIIASVFSLQSSARNPSVQYWIDQLKDNSNRQVLTRLAVHDSIQKLDSVKIIQVLKEMEQAVAGSSQKMKIRVAALKARLLFYLPGHDKEDTTWVPVMKQVLYDAYKADESFMIAEYSRWYGEMLNDLKKRADALQYCLNAVHLQENLGIESFPDIKVFYLTIGELFYRVQQYGQAVVYYNKGINCKPNDKIEAGIYANALNTLGISYKNLKKFDSSIIVFNQCMEHSLKNKREDWYYIASDNRFDPYLELKQYDSCKAIIANLYAEAVNTKDDYLLSVGCFLYGRTALRQKEFTAAFDWLSKADGFAGKAGVRSRHYRLYKDLAEVCDSLGYTEKGYGYYKQYKYLQDSMDKADLIVNSNYLFAKANFETEQLGFKKLKASKEKEIRLRNTGIITLALLSVVIIWWMNRKRKKALLSKVEAEKQLDLFMKDVLNKNLQIENLQNELLSQSDNKEKAEKIEELTNQVILTEADWQRFQLLFDNVYPGFLYRLKEKATGITEAECRMSCLIKIQLNTKQIASMQGISPDSVHKTRQRLRQRFATASTTELETIISAV
jgi:DNA-binding CsgD family transcriptional regulator